MGLHADPRRAEERRPPCGTLDDSADPESGGPAARSRSGRPRGRRFCARIGARSPARISSPRKSGRGSGLVTYYTVFVIDLASRRVHVLGSTPHPTELFMGQMVRLVTAADDGVLVGHRVLICDRDRKWSRAVRQQLGEAGIRVVLTPAARSERECVRRAVRPIDQRRMSRPDDSGRGASLPARDRGVCRALPSRTESPGSRQRADRGNASPRRGWPRISTLATGRTA